jgi:hypothetical protein
VRKTVEKSWLKQLRVAISTGASFPEKIKSTKFENKFCRLARRLVQKFSKVREKNIILKGVLGRNTRTASLPSIPSSFHAKRQGGGG